MTEGTALKFSAKIGSLAEDKFRILEFQLKESLSECFTLDASILCGDGSIESDDLVGKIASLTVEGADFRNVRHGVVVALKSQPEIREDGEEMFHYFLSIRPRLYLLGYNTRNRVFVGKAMPDILAEVLKEGGFAAADYRFDFSGSFPVREFTVQYNESDLNFIERLLEEEGAFYFFHHQEQGDKVVFTDQNAACAALPNTATLEFAPSAGLAHLAVDHVTTVSLERKTRTAKAKVKDYNESTPEARIIAMAGGSGTGEEYRYAPHARTTDEASRLANLAAQRNACAKLILHGEGYCRDMRAGYRFKLANPPAPEYRGDLIIVRTVHQADQRKGFESEDSELIYRVRFEAIPAAVPYRPPLRASKPVIPGLLIARIDGVEGEYAYLDEEGRYKVKVPFDLSDRKDGSASLPVRMSQPYSGPNYGIHFPNHIGNDIVLAFMNGDIDRPLALGTMPNPSQASPVNSRNKTESVIRTASGHVLRMDDLNGKTAVDLTTAGEHVFSLDDTPDSKGISLRTEGAHLVHMDDKGARILIKSKYGHEVLLDDGAKTIQVRTGGGHRISMDDPGKTITVEDGEGKTRIHLDAGAGDIDITAARNIFLAAGETISLTAGKALSTSSGTATRMTAGKEATIEARDGVTVEAGKSVSVSAKDDVMMESGKKFRAASKDSNLEASNTLSLKGKKVLADADSDFKAAAGKMNFKASGDIVLKGSKISQN
ncbi:MAG TPA: type VI secretion system tip protein TssI/VgrG [Fibrobacteria bacterium]|nr:type VI secretion system tip protein TssI/VgrG [Fibrobacteria bacterium]